MIFSFLKFINFNFKNHYGKETLKTREKPFYKSFIIVALLHFQLCHIIVKAYFNARRPYYFIYNISIFFASDTARVRYF